MTMSSITRARLLGAVVVVLAFAAGLATGVAVEGRARPGLNVTVTATATDVLPQELLRLGLTSRQQTDIRAVLTRGRDRVLDVVRDFDPRMKAAIDSTDAEIGAILTDAQRASWAAYRRDHPPMVNRKIIR
jgi:hypothetical protein